MTPTGVTATPKPVSITACGVDHTVTFTAAPNAVGGNATVSMLSSPAGGGGYNNQVSIPIVVTNPNTRPTVSSPASPTAPATRSARFEAGYGVAHRDEKAN